MRAGLACLLLFAVTAKAEVSALHPRIYVRNDEARIGKGLTVSQLRMRLGNPAYAPFRLPLKAGSVAGTAELAARYLEEGSASDLAAVRDFLAAHTFSYEKNDVGGFLAAAEMAIAFDWVYAGLSPEGRNAALSNIVVTAGSSQRFLLRGGADINHNYTYMALNAMAVCGLVLKGESEPYNSKGEEYLKLARDFLESKGRALDTWNARESAWGEGSHYTFHETLRTFVLTLQAYRSASDTDYFPLITARYGDFMRKAGRFLIGCTRPDMTLERIGDTSASRAVASLTVPLTVEMIADGVEDTDEKARLHSFTRALLSAYGSKAIWPEFGWGMRIFFNPLAPVTPAYQTLPLFARFGTGSYEQFSFRNGWSLGSTLITILAGDHFTDHQHFDKGQFLIYRRGGLAIDSGAYDRMYKPDQHSNEYAPRTLAHNCLLVYDPQEILPKGYSSDGGQKVIRGKQHHHDWLSFLAHREAEGLHAGGVIIYDPGENDSYAYLRADLQKAYGDKVKFYEREFVYLPEAGFLIVCDRVTSARPEYEKRWLLHFQDELLVDDQAPGAGVKRFPGAKLATIRRRGSLDLGGPQVLYDGALFVRTLLPADRVITTIGGEGFEFFSSFTGKNYPVSTPAVAAEIRESGKWRIEVAPARPAESDLFLHAIQIAEGATAQASNALIVRDDAEKVSGALLLTPRRCHVVLFASSQVGEPITLPVKYKFSFSEAAEHLITGLLPLQDVKLRINSKKPIQASANARGVLRFEDGTVGTRTIALEDVNPKRRFVLAEDFSRGMDGWWQEGGERVWAESGRLHVNADDPRKSGGGVATVWSRTVTPGDFQLDLDAHVVSSSIDANNINLFFGYSDPSGLSLEQTKAMRSSAEYDLYHKLNGYIVTFLNDPEAGTARIRIRRNPGFQLLGETYAGECRQGITYHLRLVKQKGKITFGVDGQMRLSVSDPHPHAGGFLGLRTYRTNLWWDNIRVQ
jgi:hypothetical protein